MKQNDSLFELVKTLNKSEKRYFQLYSSMQSGNKNYLKLYKELESMASLRHEYDESRIKSIFENEAFIRQLTFTKNYLMDALLKSLSQYKGTSAIDAQISSVISKAVICYEKALYRSFSQLTTKAAELCRRHERYALYLQVLELEKVIIIKKIPHARNETHILEEESRTIEIIRNISCYDVIISRLTTLYREKGRARDESVLDVINSVETSEIMRSENKALSAIALEKFFFVQQLIADLKGDLEQMYVHALKRLDIIRNTPEPFKDRSFNYMHDVIMYILLLATRLGKTISTGMYMDLLKEHTGKSESDRIDLFLIMSTLKLIYYDVNSETKVAVSEIAAITEGLEKYKGRIDSNFEIFIYNFLAKTCFSGGDFVSANRFLNNLLNHPEIGIRKDLEANAKILNLIVHYELGNLDLLEYLIKSTYRFLMRRKGLHKFESIILKFLRKLSSVSDQRQLKEQLELLYRDISALKKDPYEMNAILYFDLPKWIEHKLRQL